MGCALLDAEISIHAPAKGATPCRWKTEVRYDISIHAPAKGATSAACALYWSACYFNPCSREGSDRCTVLCVGGGGISIHAPAKGATKLASPAA